MSKKKLFASFLGGLIVLAFYSVSPIVSAYDCDNPSEEQSIRKRCETFCKKKDGVAGCTVYKNYLDCEGQCVCNNGAMKEIQSIGGGGGDGQPPYWLMSDNENIRSIESQERSAVVPKYKMSPATTANVPSLDQLINAHPGGQFIFGPYRKEDIRKNLNKFDPQVYTINGIKYRLFLLYFYADKDWDYGFDQFLLWVQNEADNMEATGKPFSVLHEEVKMGGSVVRFYLPNGYHPISDSINKTLTGAINGIIKKTWPKGKAYYLHTGCSASFLGAEVHARSYMHPSSMALIFAPIKNGDPNNFDLENSNLLESYGYFHWWDFDEDWRCQP